MIRHEILTSTLRFYNVDSKEAFEPYVAICTIQWENINIIWIKGMHGTITRAHLREFLDFCVANKVEKVKAYRSAGHTLPFMKQVGLHMELDVKDTMERLYNDRRRDRNPDILP